MGLEDLSLKVLNSQKFHKVRSRLVDMIGGHFIFSDFNGLASFGGHFWVLMDIFGGHFWWTFATARAKNKPKLLIYDGLS